MEFKLNKDFPSADRIRERIANLEMAIRLTKKTVRLHQNKKKLIALNEKLQYTIFQHNKFDLFDHIEQKLNEELDRAIKDQFENLEEWSGI
ncbi:hypothetical protein V7094_27820 [Priestia megaterium]|uniref:hypothetical protein n=1 Tax=Priestia megaterium TaxID=1404 RepID=UPI002FFF31AE